MVAGYSVVSILSLLSLPELFVIKSKFSVFFVVSIFCWFVPNSAASYLSTSCIVWLVVLSILFSFLSNSLVSKFGILSSNGLVDGYSPKLSLLKVVVVSVVWYSL